MVFKSSAVVILLSSLMSTTNVAAEELSGPTFNDEVSSVFVGETTSRAQYFVRLKQPSVLTSKYLSISDNEQESLELVKQSQEQLLNFLSAHDPAVKVLNRIKLVDNILSVDLDINVAGKLKENELVASFKVIHGAVVNIEEMARTEKLGAKLPDEISGSDSDYAFMEVNDAGDNPVVALIGSGVDYTHQKLGGEGTWTNFVEAYSNNSSKWSGFPNNVVISGFDFTGGPEEYDYNPLEFHVDTIDATDKKTKYTAGIGTMVASLILDGAPNAKFLSYKTTGVIFQAYVTRENTEAFFSALELAMDPNVDGNMDDAADIVVIDTPSAFASFYVESDQSIDSSNAQVIMLRSVAAVGALLITPAGDALKFDSFYNTGTRANVPEALTVGFTKREDNIEVIQEYSPIGPTRGYSVIKPDVVAKNTDVFGAWGGSGGQYRSMPTQNLFAAARVAATAAGIMSARPELSAAEVKALIVNTGLIDVKDSVGVAQIGGGSLNPLNATKSYALMYEEGSLQPSLNFGPVDVLGTKSFSKNVVIKNVTAETQSYSARLILDGIKDNNNAIEVQFQKDIVLAANEEITIPVTITVDADKLSNMPITDGESFNLEQWQKYALSGYVELEHSISKGASIHMPWLIMPKIARPFKSNMEVYNLDTYNTDAYYNDSNFNRVKEVPPHDQDWKLNAEYDFPIVRLNEEVINVTNKEQTLQAIPLVFYRDFKPVAMSANEGVFIKAMGGALYEDEQCVDGKRLAITTTFFKDHDLPVAKHMDRIGQLLFTLTMYNKQTVEQAQFNTRSLEAIGQTSDQGKVTQIQIGFNDSSQIAAQYIDLSMEFGEISRMKPLAFPIEVSPNNNTVLLNMCTNDFYHDDITAETFDDIIGIQYGTDRGSYPGYDTTVLTHNFNIGGHVINSKPSGDVTDPVAQECRESFIADDEGNCIFLFAEDADDYPFADYLMKTLELTDLEEQIFRNELIPACYDQGSVLTCIVQHPRLKQQITLNAPVDEGNPGELLCNFKAGSVFAHCVPEKLSASNGVDPTFWQTAEPIDFSKVLKKLEVETTAGKSLLTGTAIKIAKVTSENDEDLQWVNKLTVAPGEHVRVSTLMHEDCGGGPNQEPPAECTQHALIFNTQTGYYALSSINQLVPSVKAGQSFSTFENVESGFVLGQVQWDQKYIKVASNAEMLLISGDPHGTFALTKDGELSVRDGSLLDFERQASFELTIQVRSGNSYNSVGKIKVTVINDNDTAPMQLQPLTHINLTQDTAMTNVNVRPAFIDRDGIGMFFSSDDLPEGLVIDRAGVISGTPVEAGDFSSEIIISDGRSAFSAIQEFIISKNANAESQAQPSEGSSSGGALSIVLFMLLIASRRRFN